MPAVALATPSAKATAEVRFKFIFQLPAINGRRIFPPFYNNNYQLSATGCH
jgi:hypothetical protein